MPKLELEWNSHHSTHPSSPTRAQKPLESPPSFLALHKKAHVCMCVCVQSVLWLRAPMDEWLDSLSVSQTTRVRILMLYILYIIIQQFTPIIVYNRVDGWAKKDLATMKTSLQNETKQCKKHALQLHWPEPATQQCYCLKKDVVLGNDFSREESTTLACR